MPYISLSILGVLYLLASVRYYPDNVSKTAVETVLQMLSTAPFTIGCTLLFVSFFQKRAGEKLPWDRTLRIFLMLSLVFELLLGIQDYIK